MDEAYFGLPNEVKFCKECVISNQRPSSTVEFKSTKDEKKETIDFDENGVCSACNFNKLKNTQIDWDARENSLIELCDKLKSEKVREKASLLFNVKEASKKILEKSF